MRMTSRIFASIGAIGVDFSSSGIRMLQLTQRRGRLRVVGAAFVDMTDLSDDERSTKTLVDRLRSTLSTSGVAGRRCIVAPRRSDMLIQSVRMPQLPDNELGQAVTWEAAERFRVAREQLGVDCIRMGEIQRGIESRDEVLIVACPRETLISILEPLKSAGLRPIAVDTGFTALVRCHSMTCRRESDRSEVRALLEVGSSGSIFMVMHGDQIALCKPIQVGGRDFDIAVAQHLAIDLDVARDLRSRRIMHRIHPNDRIEDDPEAVGTERAIYEAVRALMDQIVKEVALCLRYYGVTFRGKPPARIVLAGGDALEPRFDEMLAQACKVSAVLDDPLSPVEDLFAEIAAAVGPTSGPPQSWATVAGLSLRGMNLKAVRGNVAPARKAAA